MDISSRKTLFVGPLPPPVHGFAEINRRMLARLQETASVEVFDVAPRKSGGLLASVSPWLRLFMLFVKYLGELLSRRHSALYLPLSGGYRQFIDACFASVALLRGVRVFVHHHNFSYLNHHPFFARIVLGLLRNSVHVVLCPCMGEQLSKGYCIPVDKIRVISNAAILDSTEQQIIATQREGKLVLGFLSNITAAKGCFDFIELVEAAVAQGLPIEGMMAGPVQAEIRQSFEDAINSSGCVKHIGPVYGDEKNNFLSQIDVLVFPTRYVNEAEPVTIWEAMGAGVPVISLSRGCISGMVSNDVGWVIEGPARFIEEGLQAIKYLLDNGAALANMKVAARIAFEKSKQQYANNLDALLVEISGK